MPLRSVILCTCLILGERNEMIGARACRNMTAYGPFYWAAGTALNSPNSPRFVVVKAAPRAGQGKANHTEELGGPDNGPDRPERPVEAATQASDIMPAKSLSTPITDCHATTKQLGSRHRSPGACRLRNRSLASRSRAPSLGASERVACYPQSWTSLLHLPILNKITANAESAR